MYVCSVSMSIVCKGSPGYNMQMYSHQVPQILQLGDRRSLIAACPRDDVGALGCLVLLVDRNEDVTGLRGKGRSLV